MSSSTTNPADHTDTLTGLPGRSEFCRELDGRVQQLIRDGRDAAVLRLDLDRFGRLNESFGTEVGDTVLRRVAQCLRESVPNAGALGRLGDDEFALSIEGVDPGSVRLIAEDVLRTIQRRIRVAEMPLAITASIGVCMMRDCSDAQADPLRNADLALREAKQRGRNSCVFFQPAMETQRSARTTLEASLRRALEQKEFRLHYQPQLDLQTGAIIGAEALLRWMDPLRGVVPPGAFISVAENAGLITPIGEWVIREVCRQQARRVAGGLVVVPIAVNVSALQFHDPGFADLIATELRVRHLDGALLSLEITESVLMRDAGVVERTMRQLATLGVRLALDDFGTGFSSLAYLKSLPLYRLKIDRCFISGLPDSVHDAAIVRAVLSLAAHLGVEVVAEGVETVAQAQFLREHGCHIAQGFLWGQPLTRRDFQLMLTDVAAPLRAQVGATSTVIADSRPRRIRA
jgi:diguanylate cyclase (GGDEF)-like protein